MLTVSEDSDDLAAALNSGAQGYVLKGVGSRTLAEILRSVAAGEPYVSPTLSARLLSALSSASQASPLAELSPREREILVLVAEGLSNKRIGLKLNLHEKTIKHHMSRILATLKVSNRTEAAMVLRDLADKSDGARSAIVGPHRDRRSRIRVLSLLVARRSTMVRPLASFIR